jgi:hypothetical protein
MRFEKIYSTRNHIWSAARLASIQLVNAAVLRQACQQFAEWHLHKALIGSMACSDCGGWEFDGDFTQPVFNALARFNPGPPLRHQRHALAVAASVSRAATIGTGSANAS